MSAYLKDLIERVVATFIGGFISGITLPQIIDLDMSAVQAAAYAGAAAVLSLVKGIVARGAGSPETASLVSSR